MQVAAEAGKLEVAVAHGEHFAGNEGEPAAGNRDDGIPHEADGSVRHLKLPESLPRGVAKDAGGLEHLAGNALERGVEAEGEVPDLTSEDEQDDAHLDAHLVTRHKGNHGENERREEAEDRDGLKNVQDGNHPWLDARIVCGEVAIADSKSKRKEVGDGDANDRIESVSGRAEMECEMGTTGIGFPSQ